MWHVPLQPDKENLCKMVKAFIVSEKRCTMESRIAALESANLLELSRIRGEEVTGKELKKKSGIVEVIYMFDDVLRSCEKQNPGRDGSATLMFKANGHSGLVSSLSFNSSGTFLASGCDDGILNIWAIQVLTRRGIVPQTQRRFTLFTLSSLVIVQSFNLSV